MLILLGDHSADQLAAGIAANDGAADDVGCDLWRTAQAPQRHVLAGIGQRSIEIVNQALWIRYQHQPIEKVSYLRRTSTMSGVIVPASLVSTQ